MISYIWLWIIWLWVNSDTQTNGGYLLEFWYPINGGYSLVFWYPDQWGLFIGTLIIKPMGVVHWYSDTQTLIPRLMRGYSLVLWYRNQLGLFIGILIPKPMGVIHWYSDNVTIVIRLLRIWITFEHLTILSP